MKATLAVVYKDWTKQAEDREGNRLYDSDGKPLMETVPMLKPLQLFNAEQCEGCRQRLRLHLSNHRRWMRTAYSVGRDEQGDPDV